LFPDRTPSPGLAELKKVVEPVRITGDPDGGIRVTNLHEVLDLSHLTFEWSLEAEGVAVASGQLEVPKVGPGEAATIAPPALPPTDGESWVTVRAVLATDQPWAEAGHEVAWGQFPRWGRLPRGVEGVRGVVHSPPAGPGTVLGPGAFDPVTGGLLRIGDLAVEGPRLDLWRAPTDNDRGHHGEALEPLWRRVGLDRLQHRIDEVAAGEGGLVVRGRVAPAATDLGVGVTYRWSAVAGGLRLEVEVVPEGDWPCPLPRVGLRMGLPAGLRRVEWFGRGPGEAYADTGRAARVGRFTATVEKLQTPYLYPQENGNRREVRWATLTDGGGRGLRVEGEPTVDLTARRWTSEQLDQARHPTDLVPGDRIWVNLDLAQQGIGSASCGPGVLPAYRLDPVPARFAVRLLPLA
ncbi:MAG TPA: beta-galactosidase domain 4-containing protein, partial [Actinomycetota bacterium]|nr:beta-galactosidase domain 4-containing protein [Actinomycetota bacterium]